MLTPNVELPGCVDGCISSVPGLGCWLHPQVQYSVIHQTVSPVAPEPSLLEVAYQAALSDTAPVSVSNAVARSYFDAALIPPLREPRPPARFTIKKTNLLCTSFFLLFANLSGFLMFPLSTEVLGEVLELLSVVNDAENRFGLTRRFRSIRRGSVTSKMILLMQSNAIGYFYGCDHVRLMGFG